MRLPFFKHCFKRGRSIFKGCSISCFLKPKTFTSTLPQKKGLSLNTQEAYQGDVERFIKYLERAQLNDFKKVTQGDFLHFLEELKNEGYASSSLARSHDDP